MEKTILSINDVESIAARIAFIDENYQEFRDYTNFLFAVLDDKKKLPDIFFSKNLFKLFIDINTRLEEQIKKINDLFVQLNEAYQNLRGEKK